MKILRLLPYNMNSRSGRALANALEVNRIRPEDEGYAFDDGYCVINWGCNGIPERVFGAAYIYNEEAAYASDKQQCFEILQEDGVATPEITTDTQRVLEWADGDRTYPAAFARTLTRASSGRGIIPIPYGVELSDIPQAAFYSRYIPKEHEYRVHVGKIGGNYFVLDTQKKMLRSEYSESDDINWTVRNYNNGFIYGRQGLENDERRNRLAKAALRAIGLDFGAIDIIYNTRRDAYYVLEINTAPGLEGTTIDIYKEFFLEAQEFYYGE